MKGQMSLKSRLALSVVAVWLVVAAVIGYFFSNMLSDTNNALFAALQERAAANAKAVVGDISYDVQIDSKGEVGNKLADFAKKHDVAYSISVLDAKGRIFAEKGAQVAGTRLFSLFGDKKAGSTRRTESLIVAMEPILSDENSVVGHVVYTESLRPHFERQRKVVMQAVGVAIAGLVIFIIGALAIGRQVAKPILTLVTAAQRIADGNLESISIEETGSLETRRLARSVKAMAEALQGQVLAIKKLTNALSSVSKDITGTMAHLATSASQQAAAVTETASTVEEMEKAGQSAAGNANQIVEAAEKTTEASIRGRRAVEKTNEIILKIKDDSQDISDKSRALLNSVEEVGNIIRSVNAIAEQSKILAVNASIEAAKAGEYGSGFAVVAQEVKDLAQQSKDATLQITGTLTAIRQAIETMVDTAQSGKDRTEEGVNTIANAGAIMNDLSEAIRENSDFANVIAANINQQTVGLTQIATAIEEINSTALENQNISRSIVDRTTQMNESFDLLTKMVDRWRTPEAR